MADLDTAGDDNTPSGAAARWRARLDGGDATEADWRAFTTWLEADPRHRVAFDRLEAVMAAVEEHGDALETAAAHAYATARVLPLRRVAFRRAAAWGAALAAVAAAAVMMVLPGHAPERPASYAWSTRIGERQDVALEDGSTIHLNTDTSVSVTFEPAARRVRLDKGEALFEVSPDPRRPFTVAAGDQRVAVVGTAFNVLRHAGNITITVAHGIVQASVGDDAAGDPAAVRLTAGDQYVRRERQREHHVAKVDPSATLAWRSGRLFYDDAELAQVVSDLNRNFRTEITIADDAVARLRFSGVLKLDDEVSVLRRLESFLPIAMQTESDRIVLKARQGE